MCRLFYFHKIRFRGFLKNRRNGKHPGKSFSERISESKGIIIAQKSKVKYMQYIQNNYNEKRMNIQYKQDVLM